MHFTGFHNLLKPVHCLVNLYYSKKFFLQVEVFVFYSRISRFIPTVTSVLLLIVSTAAGQTAMAPAPRVHVSVSTNSKFHDTLSSIDIVQSITDTIHETATQLEEKFGIGSPASLTVEVLPTLEYLQKTQAPIWSGGVLLTPSRIVIAEDLGRENTNEFTSTLRHEYMHAAIASLSGSNSPAWLDEGLAQLAEGTSMSPQSSAILSRFVYQNGCLPLHMLNKNFKAVQSHAVRAMYLYSLFATEQLLQVTSRSAVLHFLGSLKERRPYAAAFQTAFGMTPAEFQALINAELGCGELE